MTQRKKSITIHETRSVVDITSILTQFGRWAALVLIVTGDGNCIQYRDVNTRHRTQYTSQKKSKWKQNDNSALWTMSSSKRIANTIIVMMHYREHHLHSTTQRKNWPQKSRDKLFFSPYNSNPIKTFKTKCNKEICSMKECITTIQQLHKCRMIILTHDSDCTRSLPAITNSDCDRSP